jgi:ADP-ribosyl-[dinitrogen reductase] hydrolase
VLLGTAAGDALGAPFEFGPPLGADVVLDMTGGGRPPGRWTDDTAMAIAIAEVAAAGLDLRSTEAQDRIVARWVEWARNAPDVGVQTRAVLTSVGDGGAVAARAAAAALHERTGRSGGNGSLMRTAPVALACLHDEDALVEAATALSALTHFDPDAGEACVLWCLAIRHAVLTGALDIGVGMGRLDPHRQQIWLERIRAAEAAQPADFAHNGWVVEAFQGAWCAIVTTGRPGRSQHLRRGLEAAVRGGRDTDTVAAIAGGLLGAAYGSGAVPSEWRAAVHGWPGLRADGLLELSASVIDRADRRRI